MAVLAPLSRLSVLALACCLAACSGCATASRRSAESAPAPAPPSGDAQPDAPPAAAPDPELLAAEIATVGWDGITDSPIVLLRELSTGRVVPIWVGVAEARAIASALLGVEFPRPMTHDLMADLVGKLDAKLQEVRIHEVRDGTYYGLLQFKVNGKSDPLLVDTRPSDGLALALRTGAAIRVSRSVLDETPEYEFMAPEAGEQVVRALGLTVVAPSAELRLEFGLPERDGVVVLTVGGEAERKGLRRGDLIVEVNGAVPKAPLDLLAAVRDAPAGKPILVTYLRAGVETSVELRPEPREGKGPRQVA